MLELRQTVIRLEAVRGVCVRPTVLQSEVLPSLRGTRATVWPTPKCSTKYSVSVTAQCQNSRRLWRQGQQVSECRGHFLYTNPRGFP